MKDERDEIRRLRQFAAFLPDGVMKSFTLEKAIQLADTLNDVKIGVELRSELVSCATFSGRPDVMLVNFTWCLAQFDRNPEIYPAYRLLWQYKWVLCQAWCFPEIRREQLIELVDDMERRYRLGGYSMHAPYQKRRDLLIDIHDHKEARAAHALFRKQPRDFLSDCAACVASSTLEYYVKLGNWTHAINAAKPILDGRLTCGEEPRRTYSKLMLPLMKKGRFNEAEECHVKAMRLLAKAPHATNEFARQLRYVVLKGNLARARQIMTRNLPTAVQNVDLSERYEFYLASRLLLDRLREDGTTELKLSLPAGLPETDDKGRIEVDRLADWFTAEAAQIAARFDARNGNTAFADGLRDLPHLMKLARPVESKSRSRATRSGGATEDVS